MTRADMTKKDIGSEDGVGTLAPYVEKNRNRVPTSLSYRDGLQADENLNGVPKLRSSCRKILCNLRARKDFSSKCS